MIKKYFFIIIIAMGLMGSLFATPKAYVKINTNECLKCYAAQIYTDKLVAHVEVTLVFPGNYHRYLRYLRMQYPVDASRYTIIQSDSLYQRLGGEESSQFYLVEDGTMKYSCPMKEFARNYYSILGLLNGEMDDYSDTKLPDTLAFDKVTLSAVDENFVAFNRSMQEVLLYNGNTFYYFSPENINVPDFYKYFDATGEFMQNYHEHYELLERIGKARAEISYVSIDAQQARVLVQIPYAFMQENGNLGVMAKLFVASIQLHDYYLQWVYIDDSALPEKWTVAASAPIMANHQENLIIALLHTDYSDDDLRYLADFSYQNDTLVFSGLLDYRIPKFHQTSGRYYNYLSPKASRGLIFDQFANEVIDLHNDSVFSLPIETSRLEINLEKLRAEYDLAITDVIIQNNACRFLYTKPDQGWFLGTVERGIYTTEKLEDMDDANITLAFADYKHLVWYDPQRNEVRYRLVP
jgi:hypothetical protein